MERTPGALNSPVRDDRLDALSEFYRGEALADLPFGAEVNNHVHTRFSFSPYSPAAVAYHARGAGLRVVGSVDHESIAGAVEMKRAGEIVGMGATVGCEIRACFGDTPFGDRRLNNPDSVGNAYIVIHGVPAASFGALSERLQPINEAREERNRGEVARLNAIIAGELGVLDYDRDIRARSWAAMGGSVTERHILFGLAHRVIAAVKDPAETATFLSERFGTTVSPVARERINDPANPHRPYDLVGVFKADFVPRFFVQPGATECPPVKEITAFAREIGAIPAYPYLGDVGESPTGDKKAQRFEDAYVDELFASLGALGFLAVTYMPPRNTMGQLGRVHALAARHGLLEISGVDINSSRQSFHCPAVLQPAFRHLGESTWALVGHEVLAEGDIAHGFFGSANGGGGLRERIRRYAAVGKGSTPAGADLV